MMFPSELTGQLIGKQGKVIAQIQKDSGCLLKLSPDNRENLSIRGGTQRDLESAQAMVSQIIEANLNLLKSTAATQKEPEIQSSFVAGLSNHGKRNAKGINSAVSLSTLKPEIGYEVTVKQSPALGKSLEHADLNIERAVPVVDEWHSVAGRKSARANSAVSTGSSILHSIPYSTSGFALMEEADQKKKRKNKKKSKPQ